MTSKVEERGRENRGKKLTERRRNKEEFIEKAEGGTETGKNR